MKKLPLKSSILGVLFLLVLTGCGVKGNPVPFPAIPDKTPMVENLQALSKEESVLLKWNFQDKSGLISHIKIERSDAGQTGNECRDCPQTFAGIGRVEVKEKPADKEKRELSFTDNQAVKGNTYKYRLMLCEENENCSEAAAAEINFK
ncbi:MAG TPA: hypothetical protein PKO34_08665 [Smithellaceae bacterium]|nr:hypothetical protein [Smithellaceae bacterium]